jgi:hypothetical protein
MPATRRTTRSTSIAGALLAATLLAACGSDDTAAPTTAAPTTEAAPTTAAPTTEAAPTTAAPTTEAAPTTAVTGEVVNVWSGATVDPTALPLGDGFVSTDGAAAGTIYSCTSGNPNGGGAHTAGPWIDEANGTWDSTAKVSVQGEVSWPQAAYSETIEGDQRVIVTNDLPTEQMTGTFPIAADDPAYQYDRNPNRIAEQTFTVSLPTAPEVAESPSCLPAGAIGVLRNGVYTFASLDELNRDAVAWETQDLCEGHPQQSSSYHYHNVPSCLFDAAQGASTVVGFAFDGFPIVVERDAEGNLPANANLDECHGRTSPIVLDGEVVETYHYSATLEFPYFIGCYRGTPVAYSA